jgi:tetratricopeptide (TPR) repeat protein
VSARATPHLNTLEALFQRGRYNELLAIAYDPRRARHLPDTGTLLAATALRRTGRPEEALALLRALGERRDCSVAIAIQALLLQSRAELEVGDGDQAANCVEKAERALALVDDPEIGFQVKLYQAMHAWAQRDTARAKVLAGEALQASDLTVYAFAGQIIGLVAATQGRHMEQVSILEETLAQLDRRGHYDVWLEASLLQNIAGVVAEVYLPTVSRRLAERIETLDWSDETAVPLYHILRALAYSRSLGSDPAAILDLLERAGNIVPPDSWELISRLDRVLLLQEFGARPACRFDPEAEIRRAEEIANATDWTRINGEQCWGLLMLAELLAIRRPNDAERYLTRYRSSRKAMSPVLMGRSDARNSASEDFVEGLIAAAMYDRQRGIELVNKAFAYWESVGASWQAVRAALTLYELTGERRHIEWASREAQVYPFSWMSAAVKRAGGRTR